MSGHAEDVSFCLLQRVDKKHLQHRKVEVVQHIYDAASHQHPDDVGMNEGRWNLGEMEKFLEQRRQREPEPRIELFLCEDDDIFFSFLRRHGILPIHKVHNHAIWDTESILELLYAQIVCRFLMSVANPGR